MRVWEYVISSYASVAEAKLGSHRASTSTRVAIDLKPRLSEAPFMLCDAACFESSPSASTQSDSILLEHRFATNRYKRASSKRRIQVCHAYVQCVLHPLDPSLDDSLPCD